MRKLSFTIVILCGLLGGASLALCDNAAGQRAGVQRVFPERFRAWGPTTAAAKAENSLGTGEVESGEAGLVERMARVYSDGAKRISVTVAEFRDPSGAYEAYTAALRPGMKPSTAGALSAVDDSKLLAQIGNLLVQVDNVTDIGESDLQALVKQLHEHADPAPLPPVRGYLPERDLVDGTQRYALGEQGFKNAMNSLGRPEYAAWSSELGFASGAEIMAGQYSSRSNHGVLLLIEYPTPQLAEQHLRHLAGAIPRNERGGGAPERKGSLLSMVLAPSSAEYAARLRQSIQYETQVTWNEPSTTATDPPITSTIVKIFVGTGVFMLVAVVLGVAFGGVRVLTKRFYPGKVFDRPEQMEVLQLGLSGKRIDPRDFY
jgi:hypothetical protein